MSFSLHLAIHGVQSGFTYRIHLSPQQINYRIHCIIEVLHTLRIFSFHTEIGDILMLPTNIKVHLHF